MGNHLSIRNARESDLSAVLHVVREAFGTRQGEDVSTLVKDLLNDPTASPLLSLVAIKSDRVIGYILFTKAQISSFPSISSVILAPLAVIPDAQLQGVGRQLIEEGLNCLSESGVDLVFVLGHPEYYPRYGFKPAGINGFEASYPIPEKHANAWMVQELRAGLIGHVTGKVICAEALDQPEHWRE